MNKEAWISYQHEKLIERGKINALCETDKEYREAVKELCKRDVKFLINNFCWTYDPRPDAKPNHLPFILYPIQEQYLDWRTERYEKLEDGLTDKSRDMGVTWLVMAWDLHRWLFDDTFASLIGSRKEDLVDKTDNPDSLFYKIDYMLDKLPEWLKPKKWDKNTCRKNMLLKNPDNGNTIVGESSNAEFSRQGRYSVIDLDEYAFWENDYTAWTATAEASRCRFPLSTPNGKNNNFADLRFNSNIKVFSLSWKDHPLKDQGWYENAKSRMKPKEFAQEVDIDYSASGGDLWLPCYAPNKGQIELTSPVNPVPDDWYLWGSIDQHSKNPSACHIYAKDFNDIVYIIDERYQGDSTVDDVADWFLLHPLKERLKYVTCDSSLWTKDQQVRKGLVTRQCSRADFIIERSFIKDGKLYKWDIPLIPGAKGNDLTCRDMVIKLITENKLKISPLCPFMKWELGEALHWAKMSETLAQTRSRKEELEDINNHAWDNFKYWLTSYPLPPVKQEVIVIKDAMQYRVQNHLASIGARKGKDND